MIISKQIIKLYDTYVAMTASKRKTPIYENPTSSDLLAMRKDANMSARDTLYVRFIADNESKIVYIANAQFVIHPDMAKSLNYPLDFANLPYLVCGDAEQNGSNLIASFVSFISKKQSSQLNWDWVKRYIQNFKW